MPTYAAFLRGAMPNQPGMKDLVRAFEAAGFAEVRTVLGSGNVLFTAPRAGDAALERRAEAAQVDALGRAWYTIVRPVEALAALLGSEPYRGSNVPAGAKRVVSFLRRAPAPAPALPVVEGGARIVNIMGRDVFTVYLPGDEGPVFMRLLGRTFGEAVTTRTWATVERVVAAAGAAPGRARGGRSR
jgi:uncharacterized protein (DUF1697 family)